MSQFTVVPIYKSGLTRYSAPAFYVESSNTKDANEVAIKQSGLSRFPEWHFHVIETSKVKREFKGVVAPAKKKDPNSKSQLGKKKTGHSDSRPVRRGLRRLGEKRGRSNQSDKTAGAIKMW